MSIEFPHTLPTGDRLPSFFREASFRERREYGRDLRRVVAAEQLRALTAVLRLNNLAALNRKVIELHVEFGENLMIRFNTADDLTRCLLAAQAEDWDRATRAILAMFAAG